MYQLKTKLGTAIMLILLFAGCNRHSAQTESIMKQAKKCISEYPDSALHLLQSIPSPTTLKGKEQADYALLYTQACDKNYILSSTDSLIRFAVDYYGKGYDMNAALSYFYLGCVYWNGGRNVDAVNAFLKASEAFPAGATDRLFLQIHIYLGECCKGGRALSGCKEALFPGIPKCFMQKRYYGYVLSLAWFGYCFVASQSCR